MPRPTHDVAIAGLGAMGSATAWQLASRGQRVIGFDRFHPPHGQGSSSGRSRIIREAYWEGPNYVPLVRRAYLGWTRLEEESGCRVLQQTGGLVIGPETGPLVTGTVASARTHQVRHEVLTAGEVRRRFPVLQPDDSLVGVLEPGAGVLRPEVAIGTMLGEAARHGAELHHDEPVLSWEPSQDGVVVRTTSGEYSVRHLVLTAGAWMAGPLPGIELPLTVSRQVMFWVQPAEEPSRFAPPQLPIWLWETRQGPTWYGLPDLGAGPKVARHHGGVATNADDVDRVVGAEESVPMMDFLATAIPALRGSVREAQVCLYTNTPDEHFVLDRHPACPSVVLASPCSGHGFKFAPTIGEILADLAMDRTPAFDLGPFALGRFGRQ